MDWLASQLDVATARLSALLDSVDAATGSSYVHNSLTTSRDEIHWDYTITPKILEFVEALAEHQHTFTQFPHQHETFELTARQEKHARDVLTASSSFARLRYHLCPSRLLEHEFWNIYFTLLHGVLKRMDEMKQADDSKLASTTSTSTSTSTSASTSTSSSTVPSIDFLAEIDRLCGVGNLGRTSSHRVDDVDSDTEDDSARSRVVRPQSTAQTRDDTHMISSHVCAPDDMSALSDVEDSLLPDDAALEAAVREHGDVDGETLNLELDEEVGQDVTSLPTPNRTASSVTGPSPIPGLGTGLFMDLSPNTRDTNITSTATNSDTST